MSVLGLLKHSKAAGHDKLTAVHVQNSSFLILFLLTLLFFVIMTHSMVPGDFGWGINISLKNNEDNKTSSDNYKGITLSPVLSKLFEMILLNE